MNEFLSSNGVAVKKILKRDENWGWLICNVVLCCVEIQNIHIVNKIWWCDEVIWK